MVSISFIFSDCIPTTTVPAIAEEADQTLLALKAIGRAAFSVMWVVRTKLLSRTLKSPKRVSELRNYAVQTTAVKLQSSSEGIAFYYQEIPSDTDFELTATATVESFDINNQVSFGIMLRDKILINESNKDTLGNYIAVGPIDTAKVPAKYTFSRNTEGQSKQGDITNEFVPAPGNTYKLSLKKTGDIYVLTFGSEEPVIIDNFTLRRYPLCWAIYIKEHKRCIQ